MERKLFMYWKTWYVCPIILIFVVFTANLFVGVAWGQPQTEYKLAVMPFIKGRDPQNLNQFLSCPFKNFCYEDASLLSDSDQIMTGLVEQILKKNMAAAIVPSEQAHRVYESLLFDHVDETPLKIARRLGKTLNVTYVLVGNVWRYRERMGTSFSVEKAASVAFAVYLVSVNAEESVWEATFDETQQSLSENLLKAPKFFKRGAKWLTAKELAKSGLKDVLETFPFSGL